MNVIEIVLFIVLVGAAWAAADAFKQRNWFFAAGFSLNVIFLSVTLFAPGGSA